MSARTYELFGEALELAPAEREAWLRAQVGDDQTLFDAVRALLRADAAAGLLDADVAAIAEPFVTASLDEVERGATRHVGKVFGPYRILSLLGQGGMGSVWLAAREDGGFDQQVAIKLVAGALPTREALQRFARERQILARLAHPGIARVLDGGSVDGAAWFAMDYVDGVALDQFVRAHRLSVNDKLRLFAKVVGAVQFAHQNLVVHRDLKPSNILVKADGEPMLLDFGVAKLLDEGHDLTLSRAPLSMAYAAPEQILGTPITTATDIYGLGVILYELLSGARPHKARGNGSLALVQAITATDPEPPSRALSGETTRDSRHIKGDLDTIVMKCLARDPQRRYASAQALADDIAAYLQNQPIRARPESWRYRTGKFLRRNPRATALGVAALIAVISLAGYSTLKAREAEAGRLAAAREAERATAVQDFLIGLFEQQRPDATLGASISAKDLLDRAEQRLGSEAQLRPESVDRLRQTLARLRYDLGDFESALRLEDARIDQLERSEPGSASLGLALIERASTAQQLGQSAVAMADCDRALPLLSVAADISARSTAMLSCAGIFRNEDEFERAQALLDDLDTVWPADKTTPEAQRNRLRARAMLAFSMGDHPRAVALNTQLIEALRADPASAPSDLSTALHSRAASYRPLGEARAAIADYREALALHSKLFGARHFTTMGTQGALAVALSEVDEREESSRLMAEVLDNARASHGADSPYLMLTLSNAAIIAFRGQDYAGAARLIEESIAINTRTFGDTHHDTLALLNNLSSLRRKIGDYTSARASANEVLKRLPQADHASSYVARQAHARLAVIAEAVGDDATLEAESMWILAALKAHGATDVAEEPEALSLLGRAQVGLGKIDAARASGLQIEAMGRAIFEDGTVSRAETLADAAFIALRIGDLDRALALSRESLGDAPIAAASWGRSRTLRAALVHFRALHALGRKAEAAPWRAPLIERRKTAAADEALEWKAAQPLL